MSMSCREEDIEMSYSRWSDSRWYTYWHSTESQYIEEQLFSVDCNFTFSYMELKDDIESCLRRVSEKYRGYRKVKGEKKIRGQKKKKIKDLKELKGYMLAFILDVENSKNLIRDEYREDPEGRRIMKGNW